MAFFRSKKDKINKEFKDPPETAVFTTKFVIEKKNTITYISHDEDDGSWQFFSNDDFNNFEEVARIVSLKNIVDLDPSILEVANMPKGYYATRKNVSDKWLIHKHE